MRKREELCPVLPSLHMALALVTNGGCEHVLQDKEMPLQEPKKP